MVGFLKKLMPREDKFFDLFEAYAVDLIVTDHM